MSHKVAHELENKSPKVKIATLHPVMGKIIVYCIMFALPHPEKNSFYR